jgi:hypothetical protein
MPIARLGIGGSPGRTAETALLSVFTAIFASVAVLVEVQADLWKC